MFWLASNFGLDGLIDHKLCVRQFRWHEQFHGIPWNSMELRVRQFRWHEQFHGIPWNYECANFADTSSSMEFHGTKNVPISLTRAVPWNSWNSMELRVRQFRWHEQFHGIPWKYECANFADTSSSMEFHGTKNVSISLTRAVPWNSMELRMRQFRWHEQFHGIPWNSMELGVCQFRWHEQFHRIPWNSMELWVRQFRWHEQFHGIPWNLKCANFADMRSSMEFHGTLGAPISLTRAVPWNSMQLKVRQFRWHEQFHGIPWNLKCANFDDMSSSMEFHEQFHGIPWNLECANFADKSSSMEFHGTWSAPISLTWEVPWNSMELWVRQFRWHEQFHGIPWNLKCVNFADTSSSMEFHGTWSAPISLKWEVPWNSMELWVFQFRWHKQFHGIPWNSMELRMRQFCWHEQFHGIPWN